MKVFGASMDTKGREELLGVCMCVFTCRHKIYSPTRCLHAGMQACQAYQSCWCCTHAWSPGSLVSRRQCIFDGFRRFLRVGSRARQKTMFYKGKMYEFRNICVAPKPKKRDDEFVRVAVSLATNAQPFCGHKYVPLVAKWPSFNWYRFGIPEPMHGM